MTKAEAVAYMREHIDEIAVEWAEGLRERVRSYRRLDKQTLIRNMSWAVEVTASLIESGQYPAGSRYIDAITEMRLRYKFTIGDMIRGVLLCRDVLIERIGDPDALGLAGPAIERLLVDFAERFQALHLEQEKARSEQLVRMQEQIKRSELERQVEQAEKLASLGQLAAGLAHELGTPLNIISGNAEYVLMHMSRSNPRCAELKGIVRETDRIARMIRRMLDFARPKPLHVEPLDVNSVVHDTVDVLERQAKKAGVEIRLELDERLAPVPADRGQIEQVFVNLGLNAVQAMPNGGTLTITTRRTRRRLSAGARLGTGATEPMAAIVFADTGEGIPRKNRRRIFEPFFSTKPAGQGTGLGLAVSERIVDDHAGDIRVASGAAVGSRRRGATFTVRLPLGGGATHA